MSAAMDKALMAMSLEEVEVPFEMPDLPQFRSCERNILSLVGRLLNPDNQSMSNLILNMPRKWQKVGRVRGIALSNERFQFIFKNEHDLVEILEKSVHTFNEWTIAVERWTEFPPQDSLQFIELWVQIRNIPINYYTEKAITLLGDLVGQVIEAVVVPDKPQNQDFVRVKIKFDVSRPLRKSKEINLPGGMKTTVYYHYERIQKRCYFCQRLTHERELCPILIKQRMDQTIDRRLGKKVEKAKPVLVLKESDPLFGILTEEQVGMHPVLGRPRIAPDVLEGMRQYLLAGKDEERKLREERVRTSVAETEKDPFLQKTVLRMEPPPIISKDINKGKRIVFDYGTPDVSSKPVMDSFAGEKLMAAAISANQFDPVMDWNESLGNVDEANQLCLFSVPIQSSPTVFRTGSFESGSSGTMTKKAVTRKRPTKNQRLAQDSGKLKSPSETVKKAGLEVGAVGKRKAGKGIMVEAKAARLSKNEMVPNEGLSHI